MKTILRRTIRVLMFVITLPLIFIEVPIFSIRWLLTGKSFPILPIHMELMYITSEDGWVDEEDPKWKQWLHNAFTK